MRLVLGGWTDVLRRWVSVYKPVPKMREPCRNHSQSAVAIKITLGIAKSGSSRRAISYCSTGELLSYLSSSLCHPGTAHPRSETTLQIAGGQTTIGAGHWKPRGDSKTPLLLQVFLRKSDAIETYLLSDTSFRLDDKHAWKGDGALHC